MTNRKPFIEELTPEPNFRRPRQRVVGQSTLSYKVERINALVAALPDEVKRRVYVNSFAQQLTAQRGYCQEYATDLAERYTRMFGVQAKVGRQ